MGAAITLVEPEFGALAGTQCQLAVAGFEIQLTAGGGSQAAPVGPVDAVEAGRARLEASETVGFRCCANLKN